MKIKEICFLSLAMEFVVSSGWALKGVVATEFDVDRLKLDLKNGQIKVGLTRLKEIRADYGDAPNITSTERKVTYDYEGLKIDFDKVRYMRDWSYDSFKRPAYTDDIQKLRKDLEGQKIVGDNITYSKLVKDYELPTESFITEEDGEFSIFYWGNIKITFENVIAVNSWKGSDLDRVKELSTPSSVTIASEQKQAQAAK